MAKNKTTENESSVTDFINAVADETKRADSFAIAELMEQQTGLPPKMWGPSIIGFGTYHYKYESGREGDAPLIAFSPRASSIALYLGSSFSSREQLLAKFGKYKSGKGCINIKGLADVNVDVLKQMVHDSFTHKGDAHC
ncbi:DUF1801 domain-containing protein [Mucilaginibacter agri]|uniref:DUF1801 domain-containing protein n=1 Tax=Mucilaginibacter agri TaxID=2695265 RepID=A0A966DSF9_9SPHI|nr:DUF1801 domain-containing protein [Mucilaginibacter agri]NCD70088.1 DUF1801 domain-containing protein [Mucilaginibacter agri]